MNLFGLTGKKAIVTGGTRRLGHGMAEGLMEAGAEAIIFGGPEKVHDVATQLCNRGFKYHGVAVDLGDSQARVDAFAEVVSAMNGLNILVDCAGIQRRHDSGEFSLSDWEAVVSVNLTAPFELCQMAAGEFITRGKPGKIINISSMLAFLGGFTMLAYAAPKGAAAQMAKAFCNEWASRDINIDCIAPGYIDTEMDTALADPPNPRYAEITNRIPAHCWRTPEDMKGVVIFLASPASNHLDGAMIPVDRGYLVKQEVYSLIHIME